MHIPTNFINHSECRRDWCVCVLYISDVCGHVYKQLKVVTLSRKACSHYGKQLWAAYCPKWLCGQVRFSKKRSLYVAYPWLQSFSGKGKLWSCQIKLIYLWVACMYIRLDYKAFVFQKSFWNRYSQINAGTITHWDPSRVMQTKQLPSQESDRMLSTKL